MSEPEQAQNVGPCDHPALEELARFLLSYDLIGTGELAEGCEPIVPETLRALLNQALDSLGPEGTSLVYGRLRLTLLEKEIEGQRWILSGVCETAPGRSHAAEGAPSQAATSPWPTPNDEDVTSPQKPGELPTFDQHFRGLRGEFHAMRPRDLIQFFCSNGGTVEVYFTNNIGERGEVLIEQGVVLHVEVQGLTGNEAARRMMNWESGSFVTRPLRESPPRTVDLTWIHLLLEHARTIDESGEQPIIEIEVGEETLESLPNWMDAG